jgi:hypothetical protein
MGPKSHAWAKVLRGYESKANESFRQVDGDYRGSLPRKGGNPVDSDAPGVLGDGGRCGTTAKHNKREHSMTIRNRLEGKVQFNDAGESKQAVQAVRF